MIREDRRYEIRYDKMIREEERQADRTIHHSCSDQHNDNSPIYINKWRRACGDICREHTNMYDNIYIYIAWMRLAVLYECVLQCE